MSSLQAPRRDSAAEIRSRRVHAPINCAVGVYMTGAGCFLGGRSGWPDLTLFHSCNDREVRRPTPLLVRARGPNSVPIAAAKQPGTASDNSKVFWPKTRIRALESDMPAVILLQITAGTAKSGK